MKNFKMVIKVGDLRKETFSGALQGRNEDEERPEEDNQMVTINRVFLT